MDAYDILFTQPDDTEEDLESAAWYMGLDNAEAYGIYPTPDEGLDEEDEDNYSDNIDGFLYKEYTAETANELDGLRCGGGSFAKDFLVKFNRYHYQPPQWLVEYCGSLA